MALAAVKNDRTVSALASQFGVHPTRVHAWKKQLLQGAERIFGPEVQVVGGEAEAHQAELYEQIGRLKMELEWLKKKLPASAEAKRSLVDVGHPTLSMRRQ